MLAGNVRTRLLEAKVGFCVMCGEDVNYLQREREEKLMFIIPTDKVVKEDPQYICSRCGRRQGKFFEGPAPPGSYPCLGCGTEMRPGFNFCSRCRRPAQIPSQAPSAPPYEAPR